MKYLKLRNHVKILNSKLVNMKVNVINEEYQLEDEVQISFNVGLKEAFVRSEDGTINSDLVIELEIYKKGENEEFKKENLFLSMGFRYKINLELDNIEENEIDKKELTKLFVDYLHPSLRELINIICYKMSIDPLNIPNPVE